MKPDWNKRRRLLRLIGQHELEGNHRVVEELAIELGLAGRGSLRSMLASLEREGHLQKVGGGRARRECRYSLAEKGWREVPELQANRRIPVLGSIPAGPLNEVFLLCEEFLNPGNLIAVRQGDFFLKVSGDSMIGDGILNDDYVLIRPGVEISNGEIAAVQIEQDGVYDSTLKHVYREKQQVRLQASNPVYTDIILPGSRVNIVGGYRGLLRRI